MIIETIQSFAIGSLIMSLILCNKKIDRLDRQKPSYNDVSVSLLNESHSCKDYVDRELKSHKYSIERWLESHKDYIYRVDEKITNDMRNIIDYIYLHDPELIKNYENNVVERYHKRMSEKDKDHRKSSKVPVKI